MAMARARALLFADRIFFSFVALILGRRTHRVWWAAGEFWKGFVGKWWGGVGDEVGCGGLGRGGRCSGARRLSEGRLSSWLARLVSHLLWLCLLGLKLGVAGCYSLQRWRGRQSRA